MTTQTHLSDKTKDALEALEKELGAKEVKPGHVSEYTNYGESTERILEFLLQTYAEYKYFHSTEREELIRQQKAQREAELKERSKVIRDNIMIGILSNMTMKLRKLFPDDSIEFIVDGTGASVGVYGDESTFGSTPLIHLDYGKNEELGIFRLTTHINLLEDNNVFVDDVEVVNGNKPPRDQFEGIAALDDYLSEIEKKEN